MGIGPREVAETAYLIGKKRMERVRNKRIWKAAIAWKDLSDEARMILAENLTAGKSAAMPYGEVSDETLKYFRIHFGDDYLDQIADEMQAWYARFRHGEGK